MSEQQPKPIVSVRRRFFGEPANWRELNPLATDPEPRRNGSSNGAEQSYPANEQSLARRRRSRVGLIDGQVIVGGVTGGKTWKEELVRRGVRTRRNSLPDHKKHSRPGITIDKKHTVPSKLRTRENWQTLSEERKRAHRSQVLDENPEITENGHQDRNEDKKSRVERTQPPFTRRPSHTIAIGPRR